MKSEQVAGMLQSPEAAKIAPVFESYTKGNKTTIEVFFTYKTTYRNWETVGA